MRNQQSVINLVLADAFGRVAADLRVSLTDRCNLRCAYCMPPEGLDWLPGADVLTDEEIVRLITIGVERLGITTVRLTGGEPLLRKNLELLVADIAALSPTPEIALTTTESVTGRACRETGRRGAEEVNISLDTLDPDTSPSSRGGDDCLTCLPGRCGAPRPGCSLSRSTLCCCAASMIMKRSTCCSGRWRSRSSCGSSSRCHWIHSTAGSATR